jgi:DNA-3-methyladenine glycosylase II
VTRVNDSLLTLRYVDVPGHDVPHVKVSAKRQRKPSQGANVMPQSARKVAIPTKQTDLFRKAQRHLTRRDPILKRIIATVGPCTLQPTTDYFAILVRSIVSQMISTKAAISISGRLVEVLGDGGLTPTALLALKEAKLRGVGLSGAKAAAIRDLATRAANGALPLDRLPELSDEEVTELLVAVRGIGKWTAEMFLIFSLGRLDVLPVDDLGLRAGVRDAYGLADLPGRAELRERAEPWRPYRSVATWYFWRSRGGVPQSK